MTQTNGSVVYSNRDYPVAVNAILCLERSREAVSGCLFPDEIVCCGPAVCYVEYADPGLPLARRLRVRIEDFLDEYNMAPRVILMGNHGFIACGRMTRDAEPCMSKRHVFWQAFMMP